MYDERAMFVNFLAELIEKYADSSCVCDGARNINAESSIEGSATEEWYGYENDSIAL